MPAFAGWVNRQERRKRPALIPNSLWDNKVFTSICINVFLIWGAFNAFEQIVNLFFQEVQGLSALETALRFLPAPISGALTNIMIGLVVHRVQADWIVLTSTVISCVSPLLMAFINHNWSYWFLAFLALCLNAVGADSLFVISNLLIVSVFPRGTQGLAGGVFNTISQIGKSLGLALVALIADSITAHSSIEDKKSPEALMEGFRAAFWLMFAMSATSLGLSFWGLRGIGKVGLAKGEVIA
jgi:nitrate/nitrite transporter NarK